MIEEFISVISFIEADELQVLEKQFRANNISYIVNKHGSSSPYTHSNYYELKAARKDLDSSKSIIKSFRVDRFLKSRKCPKCGSMNNEPVRGLNFFQKLFYTGTKYVRCKKCKTKFII
jgi:formate dehydrogenase maturation protein FdhE